MNVVAPWYAFGEVVPHLHTDMGSYQFYRAAPEGMMHVTSQWHLEEYSLAAVEAGLNDLNIGIDVLAARNVDRIVVGGVPVAGVLTRPRMLQLLRDGEQRSGISCDSSFEAHIAAMRNFGVERVALATRWAPPLNNAIIEYLAAADIEVVACEYQGRNLATNSVASPAADHALLLELGRRALTVAPHAQGLMLPGGLGFVIHAAAQLERETGTTTFTNVTSILWAALDALEGRLPHTPPRDWGRLIDSFATV